MNILFISNKTLGHYNTLSRIIDNNLQNNNILFINNDNILVNNLIKKKYNLLIINCFNFIKIFYKIYKFKPDYIISCSGNIAFYICLFFKFYKIPNILIEQNYYPGKSTVIGSSIYDIIICPNQQINRFVGQTIYGDIKPFDSNNSKINNLYKKTILIVSGTLGYKKLSQAIIDNINLFNDYNVIFQIGAHEININFELYPNIQIFKNIENIKKY